MGRRFKRSSFLKPHSLVTWALKSRSNYLAFRFVDTWWSVLELWRRAAINTALTNNNGIWILLYSKAEHDWEWEAVERNVEHNLVSTTSIECPLHDQDQASDAVK